MALSSPVLQFPSSMDQAVISCNSCCSWKRPCPALAQPFCCRGSWAGSWQGLGSRTGQRRGCGQSRTNGLLLSRGVPPLSVISLHFMLQRSNFPNTPYTKVLILHISKPYCWSVLPKLLCKGSEFLDLCLMGFFLGLADFRPHLLNISFSTCT